MTYGMFGTYLLNNQLESFGCLPDIPSDYTLWKVNSDKDIEAVLNMMKIRNEEINIKYPEYASGDFISIVHSSYDDECFLVMLWFTDIFDYWFGKELVEYASDNNVIVSFDYLCIGVWDWIRDEMAIEELKERALDFYKEVIKYKR